MSSLHDHPLRYALANELHARPFPTVSMPSQAAYLAMSLDGESDRSAEWSHLLDLLDRYGASHPQPGANHYSGMLGRHQLKWESHTEFVTYTIFDDGVDAEPFAPNAFSVFPDDWLAAAPGQRVTSALIRVETVAGDDAIAAAAAKWFVPESLAISRVLDDALVIAADFRIDPAGHMRLAAFPKPDVGPHRVGRVIQRLCEIETYKTMAMLGLAHARGINGQLAQVDRTLSGLLSDMAETPAEPPEILAKLLDVSGQVENLGAQSAYRFAATGAYAEIVNQRVDVLREERFKGRQTFGEFMMRRFDPAMRTVVSTERHLQTLSDRALRAGDLLRTKVDVVRSDQNQALMTRMDKRAELQLRLQKTVEGLSVVAVSYYAVNIALYLLGPVEKYFEISKTLLAAGVTPIILLTVWLFMRRLRLHLV